MVFKGRLFTKTKNLETGEYALWVLETKEESDWSLIHRSQNDFSWTNKGKEITERKALSQRPIDLVSLIVCQDCIGNTLITRLDSDVALESPILMVESLVENENNTEYRVVEYFSKDSVLLKTRFLFSGRLVPKLNKNGSILIGGNDGVFHVHPGIKNFSSFTSELPPYLHSIQEDSEGRIWFGGYYTGYGLWKTGDYVKKLAPFDAPSSRVLPGQLLDQYGTQYVLSEENGLSYGTKANWTHVNSLIIDGKDKRLTGYCLSQFNDSTILIGSRNLGLVKIKIPIQQEINFEIINEDMGMDLQNVLSIAVDGKNRVWMSRPSQGMALYDPNTEKLYNYMDKSNNPQIQNMALTIDHENSLWMGGTNGLAFAKNIDQFNPEIDNFYEFINKFSLHYDPDFISYLGCYENHLVFGDKVGAHFLALDSFYEQANCTKLESISTATPELGSSEQNTFLVDSKNRLWLGHSNGAMMIDDFSQLFTSDESRPDFEIRDNRHEDISMATISDRIKLPRLTRAISLRLKRIYNGEISEPLNYQYALLIDGQADTVVNQVSGRSISIDYLPAGKHKLLTRSVFKNELSPWRNTMIFVPSTLNESKLFWFCLALAICSIVGYFFYANRKRKMEEQEHSLERAQLLGDQDRLKIQAIANSLNPHFINNSLYYIQAKMVKDKEAVKVVERLSRNIQSIFKKSRAGIAHLSLEEEIGMIENYLVVQSARFGAEIEFVLEPEELFEENRDFQIPLLQLQIHVENAVEHGLRNSDLSGKIKLKLEVQKDALHFMIEDNGIGRKAAIEMGSRGTQQGLSMLSELHNIYALRNKKKIQSYYDDDINAAVDGSQYGTRVHIIIPKDYQYDI